MGVKIKSYYIYCMTYLYVLIDCVAVHTLNVRNNEKYNVLNTMQIQCKYNVKNVTVNTTNLPNGFK